MISGANAYSTIYTFPSDEVARLASSITVQTGTPPTEPEYGPMALVDDNPAKFAMIDSVTGAWLFAYAAPQPIRIAALIHHDFDPAGNVVLQGNPTDSWGAPAFSAPFVIPPWLGQGTGRWPVSPWLDLATIEDYNPAGFLFWRLLITGNSQDLQLGQVVFSETKRVLDPDLQWNYVTAPRKRTIVNETAFGSKTVYSRHSSQWALTGDLRMTDALAIEMEQHFHDAEGVAHPWLLIPDGSVNRAHLVRRTEDVHAVTQLMFNAGDTRFVVEEVSGGLRPGN